MTTNKQRRIGFPTSANVGGLSSILAPMFYNGMKKRVETGKEMNLKVGDITLVSC